ncbi:gamma-glutamyl-gamma-aminobutyrate hydrolase family protein [Hyphobacterium sp. SN044]|uniref:gamma-glutamyl-gamma-aminobutyrate hydrolase family protein n=1 Tax=Hyphobacterium sp. SN044 TaxID=2912575 RepID=UPI001F2026DA|nr:gamma-glutamyl-gamma-aminobutyrate hydrolase family protein [Hyphobacterium sp. SN044]MCF8879036.1 gamma-glutamyl-gamma-aminobutyrate hydrolase family protein [Hyphobacterium sp. SN044]
MAGRQRQKPRIGITKPDGRDWLVFLSLALSVRLAGGEPVKVTPALPHAPGDFDGLLLSGGLDLNPHLYEGKVDPASRYDDARDALEMAWARQAWETEMPILAICRGCQLLNVSRGGDLVQSIDPDVVKTYPSGPVGYALYRKPIDLAPDSRLAAITGGTRLMVNSLHRRAVREPGDALHVTARESHGGIQAIEADGDRFVMGVQFHPELMIYRSDMRALFRAFVSACR